MAANISHYFGESLHGASSSRKSNDLKQRFFDKKKKNCFPIVKLARKPRNVSFLTQNLTFLRIVGYPAAGVENAGFYTLQLERFGPTDQWIDEPTEGASYSAI